MKILLIGHGKMGKTIERLSREKGFTIVNIIDKKNRSQINKYTGECDVAIEFTNPESAYENITSCIEAGIPVVSGTTGWDDKLAEIRKFVLQKKGSFFYASNFSIGVNVFFQVNSYLAKVMNAHPEFDIILKEWHHEEKKDIPSGTALTLAKSIIDERGDIDSWKPGKTPGLKQLGIESHREGNIFGIHQIDYESQFDKITITHEALSRDGFAQGAILAADWLKNKKGIFDMKDLLKVNN